MVPGQQQAAADHTAGPKWRESRAFRFLGVFIDNDLTSAVKAPESADYSGGNSRILARPPKPLASFDRCTTSSLLTAKPSRGW